MNLVSFFRLFFFFLHENVELTRASQLNATDHYGSEVSNLQLEMVYIITTNSSKRYLKRRERRKNLAFHECLNMDWQETNLICAVNNSLTKISV